MSCVVVTNTFTQLLLRERHVEQNSCQYFIYRVPNTQTSMMLMDRVQRSQVQSVWTKERTGNKATPGADDGERLECMGEPGICQSFHLGSELQPGVSFSRTQQTCNMETVSRRQNRLDDPIRALIQRSHLCFHVWTIYTLFKIYSWSNCFYCYICSSVY